MTDVAKYQPTSFGELEVFCKRICATGMVPTAYRNKPDDAMVAIMFGAELGLPSITSLQFVAVISGKPSVYGDAMAGLAISKGFISDINEHFEGVPYQDDFTAVCEVTRPNGSVVTQRFSVADAKRAGLWGKAGPWTGYPKRMMQWRSRSWAIRDAAPHALFGPSAEELQDIDTSATPARRNGPDTARDITPPEPAAGPRTAVAAALRPKRPPAEVLEVVDPHGEMVHIQPGELGTTLQYWITTATDDELSDLAESNRELRAVVEAVEAEEVRRSERSEVAAQPEAPPRPVAEPKESLREDPLHLFGLKQPVAFLAALRLGIEQAERDEADRYWVLYRKWAQAAEAKVGAGDYASIEALVTAKITGEG